MIEVVRDVLAELYGMFLGDLRLSALVVLLVLTAAALAMKSPPAAAMLLLVGSLAILTYVVLRAAKSSK